MGSQLSSSLNSMGGGPSSTLYSTQQGLLRFVMFVISSHASSSPCLSWKVRLSRASIDWKSLNRTSLRVPMSTSGGVSIGSARRTDVVGQPLCHVAASVAIQGSEGQEGPPPNACFLSHPRRVSTPASRSSTVDQA